jgi:nucleoside-diphosphate-sugar epimerase
MDDIENKVCLVTGGAGFIGSELVRQLLDQRAKVVVYDNMLIGSEANIEEVKSRIKFIKADIRNKELFAHVLMDESVDYVFNLAAEPYIPHCYERQEDFFNVNAVGALRVFLACQEAEVKRCIQYSTSEVYGNAKEFPMDENTKTSPISTYAASKLAADRLAFTLHHERKVPVIILRQFNCVGPRETQPYVIPEIISQLYHNGTLLLGNTSARRDFTFVSDASKAAIELIKYKEAEGQVYNSGTCMDYSVEELAHIIADIMGIGDLKITIDKKRLRPLDVERLQCNFGKLHKLTGWEPETDIKTALEKTVEYFLNHQNEWIWEKRFPQERVWGRGIYDKE